MSSILNFGCVSVIRQRGRILLSSAALSGCCLRHLFLGIIDGVFMCREQNARWWDGSLLLGT